MGLREKVVLYLVAVILKTALTDCKPGTFENPFQRFKGKTGYGNSKNEFIKSPSYNTKNRYVQNDFISSLFNTYPEENYQPGISSNKPLSYSTARTSSDKMLNTAQLNDLRREARKKRKIKQAKINAEPETKLIEFDTNTLPPYPLPAYGAFPEVEYPLSAMDTWTPKYWNLMSYNNNEAFLKSNDNLYDTNIHTKQTNANTYIKPSIKRGNKGQLAAIRKPSHKNYNTQTTNETNIATVIETPINITKPSDDSHNSALVDLHNKNITLSSTSRSNRKELSQLNKTRKRPKPLTTDTINSTSSTCFVGKNFNNSLQTNATCSFNNTEDIFKTDTIFFIKDALINVDEFDNRSLKTDKTNEDMSYKITFESVSLDIDSSDALNNITHESLLEPNHFQNKFLYTQDSSNSSKYDLRDKSFIDIGWPSTQTDVEAPHKLNLASIDGAFPVPLDNLQSKSTSSTLLELRNLAENILAQIETLPRENILLDSYSTNNITTYIDNNSIAKYVEQTIINSNNTNHEIFNIDQLPTNYEHEYLIPKTLGKKISDSKSVLPPDFNIPKVFSTDNSELHVQELFLPNSVVSKIMNNPASTAYLSGPSKLPAIYILVSDFDETYNNLPTLENNVDFQLLRKNATEFLTPTLQYLVKNLRNQLASQPKKEDITPVFANEAGMLLSEYLIASQAETPKKRILNMSIVPIEITEFNEPKRNTNIVEQFPRPNFVDTNNEIYILSNDIVLKKSLSRDDDQNNGVLINIACPLRNPDQCIIYEQPELQLPNNYSQSPKDIRTGKASENIINNTESLWLHESLDASPLKLLNVQDLKDSLDPRLENDPMNNNEYPSQTLNFSTSFPDIDTHKLFKAIAVIERLAEILSANETLAKLMRVLDIQADNKVQEKLLNNLSEHQIQDNNTLEVYNMDNVAILNLPILLENSSFKYILHNDTLPVIFGDKKNYLILESEYDKESDMLQTAIGDSVQSDQILFKESYNNPLSDVSNYEILLNTSDLKTATDIVSLSPNELYSKDLLNYVPENNSQSKSSRLESYKTFVEKYIESDEPENAILGDKMVKSLTEMLDIDKNTNIGELVDIGHSTDSNIFKEEKRTLNMLDKFSSSNEHNSEVLFIIPEDCTYLSDNATMRDKDISPSNKSNNSSSCHISSNIPCSNKVIANILDNNMLLEMPGTEIPMKVHDNCVSSNMSINKHIVFVNQNDNTVLSSNNSEIPPNMSELSYTHPDELTVSEIDDNYTLSDIFLELRKLDITTSKLLNRSDDDTFYKMRENEKSLEIHSPENYSTPYISDIVTVPDIRVTDNLEEIPDIEALIDIDFSPDTVNGQTLSGNPNNKPFREKKVTSQLLNPSLDILDDTLLFNAPEVETSLEKYSLFDMSDSPDTTNNKIQEFDVESILYTNSLLDISENETYLIIPDNETLIMTTGDEWKDQDSALDIHNTTVIEDFIYIDSLVDTVYGQPSSHNPVNETLKYQYETSKLPYILPNLPVYEEIIGTPQNETSFENYSLFDSSDLNLSANKGLEFDLESMLNIVSLLDMSENETLKTIADNGTFIDITENEPEDKDSVFNILDTSVIKDLIHIDTRGDTVHGQPLSDISNSYSKALKDPKVPSTSLNLLTNYPVYDELITTSENETMLENYSLLQTSDINSPDKPDNKRLEFDVELIPHIDSLLDACENETYKTIPDNETSINATSNELNDKDSVFVKQNTSVIEDFIHIDTLADTGHGQPLSENLNNLKAQNVTSTLFNVLPDITIYEELIKTPKNKTTLQEYPLFDTSDNLPDTSDNKTLEFEFELIPFNDSQLDILSKNVTHKSMSDNETLINITANELKDKVSAMDVQEISVFEDLIGTDSSAVTDYDEILSDIPNSKLFKD